MSFPIERIKLGVSPITNTIYIGRVDSKEKLWLEKREYTNEALCVVRDYLIGMMGDKDAFGYEWTRQDGKVVELTVKVRSERTDVKGVWSDDGLH